MATGGTIFNANCIEIPFLSYKTPKCPYAKGDGSDASKPGKHEVYRPIGYIVLASAL